MGHPEQAFQPEVANQLVLQRTYKNIFLSFRSFRLGPLDGALRSAFERFLRCAVELRGLVAVGLVEADLVRRIQDSASRRPRLRPLRCGQWGFSQRPLLRPALLRVRDQL